MNRILRKEQLSRLLRFVLIFSGLSVGSQPVLAQASTETDSLRQALPSAGLDDRIALYKALASAWAYTNRDSALFYVNELDAYARAHDHAPGRALAQLLHGNDRYDRGQYDSAFDYTSRARDQFTVLKDSLNIARAYLNLGSISDGAGRKSAALEAYLAAVAFFDATGDSLNVAYTQLNVGLTFKSLGDTTKALRYYNLAARRLESIGDAFGLATVANNTASLLVEMARYDSAIVYASRSREGYLALDYPLYACFSAGVLAEAKLGLGKAAEAIDLYLECLPTLIENEAAEDVLAAALGLSRAYGQLGNVVRQEEYAQLAREWAQRAGGTEDRRDAYEISYLAAKAGGRVTAALTYLELARAAADSVDEAQTRRAVDELETRYRTAEQQRSLARLETVVAEREATVARRNLQLALGAGVLLLALGLGAAYYSRSRARLAAEIALGRERAATAIITATEDERNRVSRELHDGVGQSLTALRIRLRDMARRLSGGRLALGAAETELTELADRFAENVEDVRRLSHRLMPRALDDTGLRDAIADLVQQLQGLPSAPTFRFEHHNLPTTRLPPGEEIAAYRITQELLHNAMKHSRARRVDIQVYRRSERLVIRVEDDGEGMSALEPDRMHHGHGLTNVRHRAALFGGTAEWEPGERGGTCATVVFPIAASVEKGKV